MSERTLRRLEREATELLERDPDAEFAAYVQERAHSALCASDPEHHESCPIGDRAGNQE